MISKASAIGKNIRTARAVQNMSQRELAEKSGISQTQLCDYENGNKTPGLFTLGKIASVLRKSIDELYYGDSSISFITSAPSEGAIIVNSLVALWEQGVIDTRQSSNSKIAKDDEIIIKYHVSPIKRLINNFNEYEQNKSTYSNPQEYLDIVKQSVIKEIDNLSKLPF